MDKETCSRLEPKPKGLPINLLSVIVCREQLRAKQEDYDMLRKADRPLLIGIILLLLLFLTPVEDWSAQSQKTFLWSVRSKTSTVYVLGSVHFLKQESYPLNPAIEAAFDRSSILAVEANVSDPSKADLQNLMSRAVYPDNDALDRHLSPQTYREAEKEAERIGLPIELIQKQKPWYLALTLEALELMHLGFDPRYGVDVHFLSRAATSKKKVVELESIDEQINLLSGFSDSDQELLLLYTLKSLNVLSREINSIVKAWTTGDARGVESILTQSIREEPKLAPMMRKLLDDRNVKMVSKIEGFLKTSQTYFVVVGAGHLVGNKGIVNLLKERGYPVQQH
jgi:uncharacterized protein